MTIASRLQKLLPGLTAKERARQQIRLWQRGEEPDADLARSAPASQHGEVWEHLSLVRSLYLESWALVNLCAAQAEHSAALLGWLATLQLWALEVEQAAAYAAFDVPEPITASEFEARRTRAAEAALTVKEWAEVVIEDDDDGSLDDPAYRRRLKAKAAELRALVATGVLPGVQRGKQVLVRADAFYAWRGQSLPLLPARGWRFDVRPDAEGEAVERERARRERMASTMERLPRWLGCPEAAGQALSQDLPPGAPPVEVIARSVVEQALAAIISTWRMIAALEQVAGDRAEEFDGHDLLHPEVRAMLDRLKEKLLGQRESLQCYIPAFDLPEADPLVVDRLQREIELGAE